MKVRKFNEVHNEGEYFIKSGKGIGYAKKVLKIGEEDGKIKYKYLTGDAIGYSYSKDLVSIGDFEKREEYEVEFRKIEKQYFDYIQMLKEKGFKIETKNDETQLYPIDIRE